jgi:hypothetical protein
MSFRLVFLSNRLRDGTREGAFRSAAMYWFAQALHHESHRWIHLVAGDPMGAAYDTIKSYCALRQASQYYVEPQPYLYGKGTQWHTAAQH